MTGGESYVRRTGLARRLLHSALSLLLAVLAGGFAAAALVRYSPGFGIDDNSWNPKLSVETQTAIHARLEYENRLPRFYVRYLVAAMRGDLGQSDSFHAPVTELLGQRAGVTAGLIFWGVTGGMLMGGWLAWLAVWPRRPVLEVSAVTVSGFLLALPPAVISLAFFFTGMPLGFAVALAILPRVFGTLRVLLEDFHRAGPLLAARARGIGPASLAWRYVLCPAAPQIIALTGVALVMAFGAIIPIEALCGVPGIGQLALQAALARDLPLLCGLALIITLAVALAASIGDLVMSSREAEPA